MSPPFKDEHELGTVEVLYDYLKAVCEPRPAPVFAGDESDRAHAYACYRRALVMLLEAKDELDAILRHQRALTREGPGPTRDEATGEDT